MMSSNDNLNCCKIKKFEEIFMPNSDKKTETVLTVGVDIRNIGKERTGDEVVFLELVRQFAEQESEIKFLLFTDIVDEEVLKIIAEKMRIVGKNNFQIISLGKSSATQKQKKAVGKFAWNLWVLPNYLRKNPLDIYHTQYITPFFVSRNIKIVSHIHDVSFKVFKQFIKWSDLFFLNILIPFSIRRADKIIAVSEFTKQEIEKYYPQAVGKIEVVYNAIACDKEVSDNKEGIKIDRIKTKYNLPEKFIYYIGTLQPRKNVAMLIEAYAKIREKLSDFKLVIAGNKKAHNFDKKIDEVMKKYNLSEDEVRFIGFVDYEDKMSVYSLANVLVNPSFYEGFGITPLEAMKEGTPVLISDIPAHREVYQEAGLYFNPHSLDDLQNKLYTVCVDQELRTKLVNRGLSRSGFFSWKKSAEKMLKIYKSKI